MLIDEHEFAREAFVARDAARVEVEVGLPAFLDGNDLLDDGEGATMQVDVPCIDLEEGCSGFFILNSTSYFPLYLDRGNIFRILPGWSVRHGGKEKLFAYPCHVVFGVHKTPVLCL